MDRFQKVCLAVAGIGVILFALLQAVPASAAEPTPWRLEGPDRTICIESRMGSGWSSDNAASQELDDRVWYWDIEHREGAGACDDEDQTVVLHKVNDPGKGRAWTRVAVLFKYDDDGERFGAITDSHVYMNVNNKFSRTWRQNKLTWQHEVAIHALVRPAASPEWDNHWHTDRCDSLASDSYVCMSNYTDTGPSDWDLDWIGDVYHEWFEFNASPPVFYTPPRFTPMPGGTG